MKLMSAILLFSLFFIQLVLAQTELQPGEVTFEVGSIILHPVPDYTGVPQALGLVGDLNYLTIRWNATYSVEKDYIGVKCWLNCPDPNATGTGIEDSCAGYQNCSHPRIPVGEGMCNILNPNYVYKRTLNNVTCRFYDPDYPEIEYLPYPNRTFMPVDFSSSISPVTVTVGEPFNLPVNVKTFGLLADNFTVNITPLLYQNLVLIERSVSTTEQLTYGEVGSVYPRITILALPPGSDHFSFKILTKSNVDPTTCGSQGDCTYLGPYSECIDGKCWKWLAVEIKTGLASLPEFEFLGFIQILLLATILLIFI